MIIVKGAETPIPDMDVCTDSGVRATTYVVSYAKRTDGMLVVCFAGEGGIPTGKPFVLVPLASWHRS